MLVFIRSVAIHFFALLGLTTLVTPATVRATPVSSCVGDCDGSGMVTVDELIRGINIALGNLSVDECPVFDSSGDGFVTVDEIVTAVANALNGCPIVPTLTVTATATVGTPTPITATATPTTTASPGTSRPVRVLVTTDAAFGDPNRIVTSLGTPIISPAGFVVVNAELTDESESREALLRFSEDGSGSVLLAGGQQIPNSAATIGSIGQPNAKSNGVFAFVDAANGASLLQLRDGGITPVIGLGAPGARADFESRMFVVPVVGDSVVAHVFAPGGTAAIIAIPLDNTNAPVRIITLGDTLSYRNDQGDLVDAMVSGFDLVFAEDGAGTARLALDNKEAVLEFAFDENTLLDRHVPLVQGNPAPGLAPESTFAMFSGVDIGGVTGNSVRGFLASLSQTEFPGFGDGAVFITNVEYDPLVVLQAGAAVPDVPDAVFDNPSSPALGREAAAVAYTLVDAGENPHPALGFVDYQTTTFNTVAVAGDPAPGGGVFSSLPRSFAINDNGQLVFRAGLGGTDSAYYAVSTAAPNSPVRRLVGTGDTVALPQGGSATITSIGMILPTSGLGGDATAVGTTHFTVNASLDEGKGATLLVEIGD